MQFIRKADIARNKTGIVATIGTFDGVHLGHQQVLTILHAKALELGLPSCVICFEPQPKELFMGEKAPERITPFRDRVKAFSSFGVDQVVCLQFNKKLRDLSAADFIQEILINSLNVKYLVIGDDFRFGSDRKGDFKLLLKMSQTNGFIVQSTPTYKLCNQRVSSSYIRKILAQHDFSNAAKYLGRPYSLSGRVHYGNQKGRQLGFPTINLPIVAKVAISGVFVVKVFINTCNDAYFGVANIGVRPTICGVRRLLEVHLFNFNGDLYGQYVKVEFLHYLRSEQKFASFEDLAAQINEDKKTAYDWVQQLRMDDK